MIFAIDPGNEMSACVMMDQDDGFRPFDARKISNQELLEFLKREISPGDVMAIEMVVSYGMPVGKEVFDTCVWIGRFWEAAISEEASVDTVTRMEVRKHICHNGMAKDSNIRQALIDRFGPVGTKKNPGWFYGFFRDLWSAYAVGLTWAERDLP